MKRRDFLMGISTVPILGAYSIGSTKNILKVLDDRRVDSKRLLDIDQFDVMSERLPGSTGNEQTRIKIGLIGNGWRGESLLNSFGYFHPDYVDKMKTDGQYDRWLPYQKRHENLYVDIAGICDTFDIHAERGIEVGRNNIREERSTPEISSGIKRYKTYQDMIHSKDIDAVIVATPDHSHAQITIDAVTAGKHVYLEKPMCHSIEEAVELKKVVSASNIVFQIGHENRQQMSYKLGRELYRKGVLGDVSMIQTFTNRNSLFGAWIREREFDHLGNQQTIDWKGFLCNAPWHEFDSKRYFNWQRYSDYGTGMIGNDFSHTYDCVNQVFEMGIPESVMAMGGHFFYNVGIDDLPDVFNAIFYYPDRALTMTYDGTLKSGIYRQTKVLGSEATMEIDRAIMLYKDPNSQRYKDIVEDSEEPFYYYAPNARVGVDGITSATATSYFKSGYGPTFIDGKVIDATFLHLKEWIDAIRGQGKVSCGIDQGFEETVTFCLANLSYLHKKPIFWDKQNEQYLIG